MLIASIALNAQTDLGRKVEDLLHRMTLEQKVSLCHGATGFGTKAIPELGIPEFRFTDGPNGVRDEERWPTSYFPTGISMASTWNPDLIKKVGAAIGQEAKGLGKSVQLGPAVNIDRSPLNGRTFEYYSEDPFLAGKTAVGYIQGLQAQGVVACVKHFAANSEEDHRGTEDAQMDQRTLREIYLPAFEMAIKEGHAGSVMAAYNKLNGEYCSENETLLTQILRKDWGFKGLAMSDWGAVHSTVPTAMAGLDLEMPGDSNNFLGAPLLQAVKEGKVPESVIDDKVRNILRTLLPHALPDVQRDMHVSTRAHQELAREVAEQAIVLLKNDRGLLPFDPANVRTLAVIGPNADRKFGSSGGSGEVISPYEVTPLQGLAKAFNHVVYEPGVDVRPVQGTPIPAANLRSIDGKPGMTAEYWDNTKYQGEPKLTRIDRQVDFNWDADSPAPGFPRENFAVRWTGLLIPSETGDYRIGTASDDGSSIFMDGKVIVDNGGLHSLQSKYAVIHLVKGVPCAMRVRYFQAGGDAEIHLFWERMDSSGPSALDKAVQAAKSADAAVLVVGIDHEYDTEGRDKPDLKLKDGQDALVEAVAAANPRTVVVLINGTPLEMPWLAKVSAVLEAWYPGMEGGNALANVVTGKANPSGKLPVTFPKKLMDSPAFANGDYPPKNDVLKYDEGVMVGYRYFDTKKVEPLFPFGHGLSYTSFEVSNLQVHPSGEDVQVEVDVKNTGARAGAEVAQVYVGEPDAKVDRPEKELKGFQKVFLNPGQTKRVSVLLNKRAFEYWSDSANAWTFDGGRYLILVGTSSRDIRQVQEIHLGVRSQE